MDIEYAIVHHNHDPESWRWWSGVHEIYLDPASGVRHWSEHPIRLVAHGGEEGPAVLETEIRCILAAVAGRPVLRTTDLMAVGGRAVSIYGEAPVEAPAPDLVEYRMAAE
jgi:hypothetical protein